jgi:hypothetical protein
MPSSLPTLLVLALLLPGCVSRSAPLRPEAGSDVRATRTAARFAVALAPLEVVLVTREYLAAQGLPVGAAEAADLVAARHPFLDDRYRITVEAVPGGGTRVVVEGSAPGRDRGLDDRVETLARGLEARLGGGGVHRWRRRGVSR